MNSIIQKAYFYYKGQKTGVQQNMLKEVVTEILNLRGMKTYYSYFGQEAHGLLDFLEYQSLGTRQLGAIKKYATMLDLPVSFLIGIMRLEMLDDGFKGFKRKN